MCIFNHTIRLKEKEKKSNLYLLDPIFINFEVILPCLCHVGVF